MKDDFYVGWSGKSPQSYASKARLFFLTIIVSMTLIGVVYVSSQQGFIMSIFNYGTLTEVSGHLVKTPVWGLYTEEKGIKKIIPLVGYGKKGTKEVLSYLMSKQNMQEGTMMTLRGTVFHFQEKYWMELTEKENSLVSIGGRYKLDRKIEMKEHIEVSGEIVDPKCFFGVMNPATKAIHRSCAIRCISGGMPPLLVVRENKKFIDYYFLHGEDMQSIRTKILPYVGIPVKLSGRVIIYEDWKSLFIDPTDMQIAIDSRQISISQSSLAYSVCN